MTPTTCPHCSYVNPDQSAFCARCGNRMQASGLTGTAPSNFALPTEPASGSSLLAGPSYQLPAPAGTGPFYQPPIDQAQQPPTNYPPPGYPPPGTGFGLMPTTSAPPPPAPQFGTTQGLASIRRAFAGRGTLVMHHSWLLDGGQAQAVGVRFTATEILRQRNIAGLGIANEKLMERGILTEERDYVSLRRGVTTVFLQASPVGQDLYISRATTVLPHISVIRVAIYATLLLIMIIGLLVPPWYLQLVYSLQTNSVLQASQGNTFTFFCSLFAYPILLFLIWQLIRSFINWLVEKDFWYLLRPDKLNDFQLDDIAFLEHLTDNIVRDSVQRVGLDATKIVPPTLWYQPKQRIRSGSLFYSQPISS